MRLYPVILAGGRGERFWPLSRRARPKQLLPLLSERSMLADTLARLDPLAPASAAWILTARDLAPAVRVAVPAVPELQVVGEPTGKNTAPAIALASWWLHGSGADAVAVVLPSDHRIEPADAFRKDLEEAAQVALERSAIVVIGIPATRPETGYGYIEAGERVGSRARRVAAFREKPDRETAARYLASGHLWNAGMFVFTPEVMLKEIRAHAPEIASALEGMPRPGEAGAEKAIERYYAAVPSISIDYAVMERTRNALVLPARFTWDDLGSWAAMGGDAQDESGNTIRGRALLEDVAGSVIFAEEGLVAAVGVRDLVIVRTGDVTLVCPRERAQDVRALVERLRREADASSLL